MEIRLILTPLARANVGWEAECILMNPAFKAINLIEEDQSTLSTKRLVVQKGREASREALLFLYED
jgi:hypothetical protein